MIEAFAHLAFEPRETGLVYAMFWFGQDDDVFGWFIGPRKGKQLASYFMLQDYYSARDTRFFRSAQDDVYGDWVQVNESGDLPLPHAPPVPEPLCHELLRLQNQFIQHWLFFDMIAEIRSGSGAGHEAHRNTLPAAEQALHDREVSALRARELPVRHVNIRAARLGKLDTSGPLWRHDSPGADTNVLDYLADRWPLDEPRTP